MTLLASGLLVLAGCQSGSSGPQGRDKGPPEVGFRIMRPTTAPLETDLPGRVAAARSAEVRPQISGVIQQRLFTEGALVRVGQPLYRIDASQYQASVAQAQANLASAQANADAQQARAARYRPLAEQGAIAAQDYTDAAAAARQARASIAQTRAALQSARINLRYTTVPAPITGRVGRSLFTEGALVTTGQADPLAVISVLDPVFVDLQQSAADMMRLRKQLAADGTAPMTANVRLMLDDGTEYPIPGQLAFSEVTADPATGTVTLRARFANPQGLLLPGMFVRAKLAQASQSGIYLVPQVAVSRDPRGNAQVLLVGKDGKAELRRITATRMLGSDWIVTEGLAEGEKVITQGLGKAKPGQPVKPVPETAPQGPKSMAKPAKAG